ncbi:MAG: low temperature requirement protein A [Chloroflexia bacterium]|nr:low temperature requirement protein A [Chloroflexia bacterium]
MNVSNERHASWLELFFDLVFVAAVAALARQLHADHSIAGLAVFAGLFVPVWWGWMGYTWYAAGFDSDDPVYRVGMLAGMLAIASVSAGISGAAQGNSRTFVIAYAGLTYVLAALYARAWLQLPEARPRTAHLGVANVIGASVWLSSLAVPEHARPFLWAGALLLLIATFASAPWSLRFRPFHPAHVAERYGLFTIIVLGESVVVTVASLDIGPNRAATLVAGLGFVIAATIWWLYFSLFRSMPLDHGFRGRFVWAQGHLLIFAGIAAAAVGIEFAVEAASHGAALTLVDRLPLGAGLAAYLTAMAAIRATNRRLGWVVSLRLAAAGIVVVLTLPDYGLTPLLFVTLLTLLLAAEAMIEVTRASPP